MAMNSSRSCNAELWEGMSDRKYKKVVEDRGGVVEATTQAERNDLNDWWFGIHETNRKVLPDGSVHVTPGYEASRPLGDML